MYDACVLIRACCTLIHVGMLQTFVLECIFDFCSNFRFVLSVCVQFESLFASILSISTGFAKFPCLVYPAQYSTALCPASLLGLGLFWVCYFSNTQFHDARKSGGNTLDKKISTNEISYLSTFIKYTRVAIYISCPGNTKAGRCKVQMPMESSSSLV